MEKLYIRNFGPIRKAEISVNKITVLIGEQGSGKSTIAKLYALFTWLEKALARRSITEKYLKQYSRFKKTYCAYYHMDEYFVDLTELRFEGIHYIFAYREGKLDVSEIERDGNSYYMSKVMYVPAERIVLGCVDHPSGLKGLGESMKSFSDEYEIAKRELKNGYRLPFDDANFEYDVLNDIAKLRFDDHDVKLSDGASGFQSALPLLLVSKNLSDMVANSMKDGGLSNKEQKELQREVDFIMNDSTLSEDVKKAFLRNLSSKYRYSRFVNVVEEMELNLYPDSQRAMLYELIAYNNKLDGNRLLLTTHSPYVVDHLTLAIKAGQVADRTKGDADLTAKIYDIIPQKSLVDAGEWVVYQVGAGSVQELEQYDNMPSDENFLRGVQTVKVKNTAKMELPQKWEKLCGILEGVKDDEDERFNYIINK